jgi:tRNA pseudouridine38-40 synthase
VEFFYKITLSYDGSSYFGWQKNSVGPSIESCLERVLTIILQEQVALQAASRTDAGVHAMDQVVTFCSAKFLDTSKTLISLNQLLPLSIRCLHLETTTQDFHPTLSSLSKTYRYHVVTSRILSPFQRSFSWHFPSAMI